MTTSAGDNLRKFQDLLRDLFQFDSADLDFGIYRIMNHRRDAIERFVAEKLPASVSARLDTGSQRHQTVTVEALDRAREAALKALGPNAIDPDGDLDPALHALPVGERYLETLRAARAARGRPVVEADVYNHLYTFFSRYYQDGDFISKRRYSRSQRYAIPYNGEEVYLHWANADQYYVKTAEHFRNYDWNTPDGVSVRFRVSDANIEQNNVKGANRFFVPRIADVGWDADARALTIPFDYRPLNAAEQGRYGKSGNRQDKIIAAAANDVPNAAALTDAPNARAAIAAEHRLNGKDEPVSRLEHHLRRYARRNDSDFFIHKDLRAFLARELDFYLKNEVLNLDDLSAAGADMAQGWFQEMRIIKSVGADIIDFLAQIEEFQKMLWEKRKFVAEAHYCIALANVPEDFYPRIIANDAQWDEWQDLYGIDTADRSNAFLDANPTLLIDTAHFDSEFTDALLATFDDLDAITDGLLIHSDNWQGLSLLSEQYKNQVDCIYIDPPYNTGQDNDFFYKDSYQHSSWMSMMSDRLILSRALASNRAGIFISTDDGEYANLKQLMDHAWGTDNFIADVIWNSRKSVSSDTLISFATNHTTFFAADKEVLDSNKQNFRLPQNGDGFSNPNNDPNGPWTLDPMDAPNIRENLTYLIVNPATGQEFMPPEGRCWRFEKEETENLLSQGRIVFGRTGTARPQYKRYLSEARERGRAPTTLWDDVKTTTDATRFLLNLYGTSLSRVEINKIKPKPSELIERCVFLLSDWDGVILDYFAGSGTTAHAVINLNREDGGRRKFILVEMGEYFDTVLLPRVKKVAFTPEWKNGSPVRPATPEEAERSPRVVKYMRLESYEDALDGIAFDESTVQLGLEDRFGDEYLLKYMLKWETKDSRTLLNVQDLTAPFSYVLRARSNGETRELKADVAETFNYLIGLRVRRRRVEYDGETPYLIFSGETRESPGKEIRVIWRETAGWSEEDFDRDRAFLTGGDLLDGADTIYANGGCIAKGVKALEPIFNARMFTGINNP